MHELKNRIDTIANDLSVITSISVSVADDFMDSKNDSVDVSNGSVDATNDSVDVSNESVDVSNESVDEKKGLKFINSAII